MQIIYLQGTSAVFVMRIIPIDISKEDDGRQIKDILRQFGVSSSLLTRLKQTKNGITKNGSFARAIDTVSAGDELCIRIENKGSMPSKTAMDIPIVYEDEDLIVLNKPPLVPVHESRNHRGDTLSNFVAYHLDYDTAFRAVFRLDRDTSGLVLVAKHELAASKTAGKIKKDYYAVVHGQITESGQVIAPIARCGDSIIKRCVSADGDYAETHYEPVKVLSNRTLLRLNLITGRTHQIRVHMAHIGHPLLGDSMYGGATDLIGRQALHCGNIEFVHPISEEKMCLTAEFPFDFSSLIAD